MFNKQTPIQGNLQKRLESSLLEWYSGLSQPLNCALMQRKIFRWSEHLLFQILEGNVSVGKILVKLPRRLAKGNRKQDRDSLSEERSRLEYVALAALHAYFHEGRVCGINGVRPLGYFSDIDALVLEYLPGENLLSIMKRTGIFFGALSDHVLAYKVAFDAGRLLAYLHQMPDDSIPKTKLADEADIPHNIEYKKNRLLILDPSVKVKKEMIKFTELVSGYLKAVDVESNTTRLHGDYYPENIVRLSNGNVYTVDTLLNQTGWAEQDIAKFLVGTENTKWYILFGSFGMDKKMSQSINRDFLKGYQSIRKIDQKILMVFLGLGLMQRWIEILEVLESYLPSLRGSFLIRARIRSSMLRSMEPLKKAMEKEIPLYE